MSIRKFSALRHLPCVIFLIKQLFRVAEAVSSDPGMFHTSECTTGNSSMPVPTEVTRPLSVTNTPSPLKQTDSVAVFML
jgi:hypothetical protein